MSVQRTKFGVSDSVGESPDKNSTKVGTLNADFDQLASSVRRKSFGEIKKHKKLIDNLRADLEKHGDAELWKRYGDLILANVNNAERRGDFILVTDYFNETAPIVEIEGDANKPLTEVAEEYFRSYVKARNGNRVIGERMAIVEKAMSE